MSPSTNTGGPPGFSREERTSAIFASMVLQQTNIALMLLGKLPHPETQERLHDPESAQAVIDQLEMIEAKTRGNLSPDEDRLLRQSLMALRMAFVEMADRPSPASSASVSSPPAPGPTSNAEAQAPAAPTATAPASNPSEQTSAAEQADSRKKFTKRYE